MAQPGTEDARRLGAEMRGRRLARGMSLRRLAKELGLSGHGTLVDYEHGRRIPPEDLIIGCERIFQISDGALRNLREKALAERASQQADLLLNRPVQPTPTPARPADPADPARRRQRWLAVIAIASVLTIGLGLGTWRLTARPGAAPAAAVQSTPPTPASRTVVASWGVCWGGQVAKVEPTNAVTYAGTDTLQITVTKPNTAGDFATCTSHGLATVHSGTKVSVYLRVPAPEANVGGVGFFVYDSQHNPAWAPETPNGDRVPLPSQTNWQRYVWTVPTVDKALSLGMAVYSATDQPLIVWLGAVAW